MLEATGISAIPGSSFGQKEGTHHLRLSAFHRHFNFNLYRVELWRLRSNRQNILYNIVQQCCVLSEHCFSLNCSYWFATLSPGLFPRKNGAIFLSREKLWERGWLSCSAMDRVQLWSSRSSRRSIFPQMPVFFILTTCLHRILRLRGWKIMKN